jgi:hypothetical protein
MLFEERTSSTLWFKGYCVISEVVSIYTHPKYMQAINGTALSWVLM